MAYVVRNYGKGKIVNDPNNINDDDYVMFDEYIADSFEELPIEGVKIGDRAMFVDNGKIGVAMYFTTGWLKGE